MLSLNNYKDIYEEGIRKMFSEKNTWGHLGDGLIGANATKKRTDGSYNAAMSTCIILSPNLLLSWYIERDIKKTKLYLFRITCFIATCYIIKPRNKILERFLFYPIMSDDEKIMAFFANYSQSYTKAHDNPKENEFRWKQVQLALRGDWETLKKRALEALNLAEHRMVKPFLPDHQFYLALAEGDVEQMTKCLQMLTDIKTIRRRYMRQEDAYLQYFMSSFATMYAKIAWRHGYHLNIETPFIPKEWLPISPLEEYHDEFGLSDAFPELLGYIHK